MAKNPKRNTKSRQKNRTAELPAVNLEEELSLTCVLYSLLESLAGHMLGGQQPDSIYCHLAQITGLTEIPKGTDPATRSLFRHAYLHGEPDQGEKEKPSNGQIQISSTEVPLTNYFGHIGKSYTLISHDLGGNRQVAKFVLQMPSAATVFSFYHGHRAWLFEQFESQRNWQWKKFHSEALSKRCVAAYIVATNLLLLHMTTKLTQEEKAELADTWFLRSLPNEVEALSSAYVPLEQWSEAAKRYYNKLCERLKPENIELAPFEKAPEVEPQRRTVTARSMQPEGAVATAREVKLDPSRFLFFIRSGYEAFFNPREVYSELENAGDRRVVLYRLKTEGTQNEYLGVLESAVVGQALYLVRGSAAEISRLVDIPPTAIRQMPCYIAHVIHREKGGWKERLGVLLAAHAETDPSLQLRERVGLNS